MLRTVVPGVAPLGILTVSVRLPPRPRAAWAWKSVFFGGELAALTRHPIGRRRRSFAAGGGDDRGSLDGRGGIGQRGQLLGGLNAGGKDRAIHGGVGPAAAAAWPGRIRAGRWTHLAHRR